MNMLKKGSFTATITLEHNTKEDAIITNAKFTNLFELTFSSFVSISSIVQTFDGGYAITGNKNISTSFVLKLNSSGAKTWEKTFSQNNQSYSGKTIVQTPDGGYAILGNKIKNGIFRL